MPAKRAMHIVNAIALMAAVASGALNAGEQTSGTSEGPSGQVPGASPMPGREMSAPRRLIAPERGDGTAAGGMTIVPPSTKEMPMSAPTIKEMPISPPSSAGMPMSPPTSNAPPLPAQRQ